MADPQDKFILIADNDDKTAEEIDNMLKKDGFKTMLVKDGVEASHSIRTNKFDLIILEIQLPIMSGFEIIKLLQTDEHNHIPVSFYSILVTDGL